MQVKDEDISTLIELQHNDMELLRVQKAIADLPQRKTIVAARKKIKTIEEKQETVGKLRAKAEEKLAGISEEDGKLAAKQEEAQKAVGLPRRRGAYARDGRLREAPRHA